MKEKLKKWWKKDKWMVIFAGVFVLALVCLSCSIPVLLLGPIPPTPPTATPTVPWPTSSIQTLAPEVTATSLPTVAPTSTPMPAATQLPTIAPANTPIPVAKPTMPLPPTGTLAPIVEPTMPAPPTSTPCAFGPTERCGAFCKDGTRSSATGRGACSGHSGVDRWITGCECGP